MCLFVLFVALVVVVLLFCLFDCFFWLLVVGMHGIVCYYFLGDLCLLYRLRFVFVVEFCFCLIVMVVSGFSVYDLGFEFGVG